MKTASQILITLSILLLAIGSIVKSSRIDDLESRISALEQRQ